jgi:sigma-B regulation protein RsbU (phosphoserine phosphatase)
MIQHSDIHILIVDDETVTLDALKRLLRKESYTAHFASGGAEALDLCKSINFTVVITDLRMAEMSGIELIDNLKVNYPDIIRIILSGTEDIDLIVDSINTGQVFRFIPKPIIPEIFKSIINDAIGYYKLLTERKNMTEMLERNNVHLQKTNDTLRIISAELRESEVQFRSMNDAAFDPIFLIDESGYIVYVNRAGQDFFHLKEIESRRIRFIDLVASPSDTFDYSEEAILGHNLHCYDTDGCKKQIQFLKHDGSSIPFEITKGSVHIKSIDYTVIIARDISLRINAEKSRLHFESMQKDLEAQIEKKLLQGHIPNVLHGTTLGWFMISSGHLNGDFLEFIAYDHDNQTADIVLGDVMGHGILSALVGAGIKSRYLKTVAKIKHMQNSLPDLEDIVSQLHDECILELLELNIYTTLLFVRLDLKSEKIMIIDCGHTPTIHFHADSNTCTFLKGKNLPLGMIEKQKYETLTFSVKKDDIIVLYSDGITECRLADGSLFGIERLTDLISENHYLYPDPLVQKIKSTIFKAKANKTFDDDATCIVIRIGERTE